MLNEEDRTELLRWRRRRSGCSGLYVRAGTVLDCVAGSSDAQIAERHQTSQQTATKWPCRFDGGRLPRLYGAHQAGQPGRHGDEQVPKNLDTTLNRRPCNATHWSVLGLSAELGVLQGFVHRVWRAFGLKPHLSHRLNLLLDRHLLGKVCDAVGLYVHPPDKAPAPRVDQKSQIQAQQRMQQSLPLCEGATESHIHDPRRCGTLALFAALDVATTGKVIGQLKRSIDISFLRHIDHLDPNDQGDREILDNYGTRMDGGVRQWLLRNSRFRCHFTSIHSSWINQIERFYASLTEHELQRGSLRSSVAPERSILDCLENHHDQPNNLVGLIINSSSHTVRVGRGYCDAVQR